MLRNRHLLYETSKVIKNSFLLFSKIGNASLCFCFWLLFGFSLASIRSACRWIHLRPVSVPFDSVSDFLFLSNIDPPFAQTLPHKISILIKGRLPGCLAEFSEGFTVKGFAIHNSRDFKIQRRGRQRERQRDKRFYKQNNNFARASHSFAHFFARFCTTTTWKCLFRVS